MSWALAFLLWFLGSYVAALGFSSAFAHWGRSKLTVAILVWPLTILILLTVVFVVCMRRKVNTFLLEWKDQQ